MSKSYFIPAQLWQTDPDDNSFSNRRIVSQYYREGYLQKGVDLSTIEKKHALSYAETVPSLLFFAASFVPLIFPHIRILWLQAILLCTVLGYSWLAIKSVC